MKLKFSLYFHYPTKIFSILISCISIFISCMQVSFERKILLNFRTERQRQCTWRKRDWTDRRTTHVTQKKWSLQWKQTWHSYWSATGWNNKIHAITHIQICQSQQLNIEFPYVFFGCWNIEQQLCYHNNWNHVSHVVGVLQIYYLLSCAVVWLSQHYYAIATVVIYKSHYGALLNVRTKGLREFKQGLVSYKEEYKRKLNYKQWQFNMLNHAGNMTARMERGITHMVFYVRSWHWSCWCWLLLITADCWWLLLVVAGRR